MFKSSTSFWKAAFTRTGMDEGADEGANECAGNGNDEYGDDIDENDSENDEEDGAESCDKCVSASIASDNDVGSDASIAEQCGVLFA